jgi:hypothetical protein
VLGATRVFFLFFFVRKLSGSTQKMSALMSGNPQKMSVFAKGLFLALGARKRAPGAALRHKNVFLTSRSQKKLVIFFSLSASVSVTEGRLVSRLVGRPCEA